MRTQKFFIQFSLVSLLLTATDNFAGPITVKLTSRSVAQDAIAWFAPGVGAITTFTTTYDGSSNTPLYDEANGGFSGEVRPQTANPRRFEADYSNHISSGANAGYGYAILDLPGTDNDGDSIPDIFQVDKAATITYTGLLHPDQPAGGNFTTRGTMSKRANETTVSHTFNSTSPSGDVQFYSASIYIGYFSGNGTYSKGNEGLPNQLDIALTGGLAGENVSYRGTPTYVISNANELLISAFTARRQDGFALSAFATTLRRIGNRYIGEMEVSDGNLSTYWRDYTRWVLEIIDVNDADGDGIPDLTDPVNFPPTVSIIAPVANAVLESGKNINLQSIVADNDGTVARVEYFAGNVSLGTVTAFPFTLQKSFLPGRYDISAIATDNLGATKPSTAISINVAIKPSLNIERGAGNTLTVTCQGTGTLRHVLQGSPNPEDVNWTEIKNGLSSRAGVTIFTDIPTTGPNKYFRVVAQ